MLPNVYRETGKGIRKTSPNNRTMINQTNTFNFERPLSALRLLTDNPPPTVSSLDK